tara:strand:+ start:4295 stop:4879 length:585 start_codon:yes stop_codon:yes gene_type:complete
MDPILRIYNQRDNHKPTAEYIEWVQDTVREENIGRVDPRKIIRNRKGAKQLFRGKMYTFSYMPKGRDDLPYYDRYPLMILEEDRDDSIYGWNLHYLPYDKRDFVLFQLLGLVSNQRFDATTRFRLTYQLIRDLSKYRWMKNCYRRYKRSRLIGKIVLIPADQWFIASRVPFDMFMKKSKSRVWTDTRRKFYEDR